jgi:UDP-N-acetylglucosamine transferase subunit ALG13
MIFITLGTTKFSTERFDNLVRILVKTFPKEKLICQSPTSILRSHKHLTIIKEIDPLTLIKYLKKARITITHGGPATIFLALEYSKNLPLVIPRLKALEEHVNDHQLIFTKYLATKRIIKLYSSDEKTFSKVIKYCQSPLINNYKKHNEENKLVMNLINYIERN